MDMADRISETVDCGNILPVGEHCPGVELHGDPGVVEFLHEGIGFLRRGYPVRAVAYRVRLKRDNDAPVFGDATEAAEEIKSNILCIIIRESGAVAVLR